jgi:hypothetical protein
LVIVELAPNFTSSLDNLNMDSGEPQHLKRPWGGRGVYCEAFPLDRQLFPLHSDAIPGHSGPIRFRYT